MAQCDFVEVWNNIQSGVEPLVTALAFDLWVKTLQPLCIVGEKMILLAESEANRNLADKRFHALIKDTINKLAITQISDVEIIAPSQEEVFREYILEQSIEEKKNIDNEPTSFIPKYTFENFVVGKSNEFVAAASKAVAENPGRRYNPLFIYGAAGLGKTHLMHAIGNQLHMRRPDLHCLYVSSEHFTNNLIEALRDSNKNDEMKRFRSKYRNIDVLMIDDIQFIAKTVSTQEEFFHTFNDLYSMDKQIVISSDRPPKEITPLEERLRTRFEGGLIADVEPPDLETRIAILQKKALQDNHNIPNDVLKLIAEKVQSNVREMEGLLTKVISYAALTGRPVSDNYVLNEALKDFRDDKRETITIDRIVDSVCNYYKLDKELIVSKKKSKEIVEPRQICIYLITDMLTMPLMSIGEYFGGRDHTTVIQAYEKISESLKEDENLQQAIN
ncbi:MAG: chromosomal replication initiator protein DnaA, partial [Clostridia bacterium]